MMVGTKKILLLTGSMNQTTQMHEIAKHLSGFDCWFSQVYVDSPVFEFLLQRTVILNKTILGNAFRKKSEEYCRDHGLKVDYGARANHYDLVICCTDLIVPLKIRRTKTVWVQKGMIDPYTIKSRIVKLLGLPPWLCGNTSLNGSTDQCDIYCVASEGYRARLAERGTQADKIFVTGIPNHDHVYKFKNNTFPYRDYVMVATSDMRETWRFENRIAFIRKAVRIAGGRRLLFKLHPNEKFERAHMEIVINTPLNTLIFNDGDANEMVANCQELITRYSTLVYTGINLGKKVHSYFDLYELSALLPVQNEGTSAARIANICRNYLELDMQSDQSHELLKKARITYMNKLTGKISAFFILNYSALIYLLQ
jgi:hypothetical protein